MPPPPVSASDLSEGEIRESRPPSAIPSAAPAPFTASTTSEDGEIREPRAGSASVSSPVAARGRVDEAVAMEVDDVGEGSSLVQDVRPLAAQNAVGPVSVAPALVPVQLSPQQWAMAMPSIEPPPLELALGDAYPLFGKFVKRRFLVPDELAKGVLHWSISSAGKYTSCIALTGYILMIFLNLFRWYGGVSPVRVALSCIKIDREGNFDLNAESSWRETNLGIRVNGKKWHRTEIVGIHY